MKSALLKNRIISVIAVSALVLPILFAVQAEGRESLISQDLFRIDDSQSYAEYSKQYDTKAANDEITLTAANGFTGSKIENYLSSGFECLIPNAENSIGFTADIPSDSLFTIEIDYSAYGESTAELSFQMLIDDQVPFREAGELKLSRQWEMEQEKVYDASGNQIRPVNTQKLSFRSQKLFDTAGYFASPLQLFLAKGTHKIAFKMLSGSIAIKKVILGKKTSDISYQNQLAEWKENTAKNKDLSEPVRYEAENILLKSDKSIYPQNDRSSASTRPYELSKIVYNTIGGNGWSYVGQWIDWELEVPEDGFYTLGFRWRQNLKSIGSSYRKITIDGKVPFSEMESVCFPYDTEWQASYLGGNKEPYSFFLTKGTHQLRMEVVLGEYADVINRVNSVLSKLNTVYLKITSITGVDPDLKRDYEFGKTIPETIDEMNGILNELTEIKTAIINMNAQNGENVSAVKRLITQLDYMVTDTASIAKRLGSFKDNISALGTWLMSNTSQPLELDYIYIGTGTTKLPKAERGFLLQCKHYLGQFISSFFEDYSSIGSDTKNKKEISVWVGAGVTGGRDQAQMLKQLINNDFSPKKNISVNLKLASVSSLLPATLAGIGPDVAHQLSGGEPLNYAYKNALTDLNQFPDAKEVYKRFSSSAVDMFRYKDGVYALPETQSFPMLFYRKDILTQIGVTPDELETWDSLFYEVLPKIQKNNMQFGFLPLIGNFGVLLYQNGGTFYHDNGKSSGLNSEQAVETFETFTSLYSDYKLPISFDFVNRFRTGEIPLAVTDYSAFNQLSVFAPEIEGLWGMCPVPGTVAADGSIDRSDTSTVSGCVLFKSARNKDACWEYMKWWTSAEIQTAFGQELESLLGIAGRYCTANIDSMRNMGWKLETVDLLNKQWETVKIIPETPGSYYTDRYFGFTFRDIVYNNMDSRESINKMVRAIDKEIVLKRSEYGTDH